MKDWSSFSEFQFMYKHNINSCFQPINSYEKIIKRMSKQVNTHKTRVPNDFPSIW